MSLNCVQLLTALPFSCTSEKMPGGVRGTVYIGERQDLLAPTFGANGDITVLPLASGKKLYKFEGKKMKHNPKRSLVPGSTRNMFKHDVPLVLYAHSQAEIASIENLCNAERLFCIYETEGGQMIASGIDVHPFKPTDLDDERGLRCDGLENSEGTQYNANEENAMKVNLSGEFFNLQKVVTSALATRTTLAQILTDLDLLTV